jgi:hypothetical protein
MCETIQSSHRPCPVMALVHASVRHCRLHLTFPRQCPEKTHEFSEIQFFFPCFEWGGVSQKALRSDGGVGWELRRLY